MKRFLAIGAAVVAAALIIGAAVAIARPDWLPARIRTGLAPGPAPAESAGEDAGLFCQEHGVPEKFCTLCHEELKEKLQACREHGGLPEDICTLCHPEVKDKYRLRVCKEHGLPESYCSRCGKAPSASLDPPDDGWCVAHKKPEDLCVACKVDPTAHGPADESKACRKPLPLVRLASAKLAGQIGIQVARATEESHAHKLTANAEAAYDANRYADITPRVGGFLREVRADLGKVVEQGEVLAVVDSAEVSTAKAQYITARAAEELARATYDRTRPLAREGVLARKGEIETLTALNQAKASLLDASQRLKNFGFDDRRLGRILKDNDTSSFLDVISPLDGTVVVRHAVRGEPVQATAQVFSVTDTSVMWLWVDVYESDIAAVKVGQQVSFVVSGNDETSFRGTVNWIGTEVNPQTRTTRIRAELANPEGRLRANQFGQAEIRVGEEHKAVVVPKAAVQRKDDVDVVFLPEPEGDVYRPQRVVTKPTDRGDVLEVAWGLRPGQKIVTKGAFLLKTEIMKGAIGAGCCE
ncbi:Cobalt-zinc-cadmium resistance protein CzcB [Aquisphaera giovannonii]|uniref:Cobalt-zinc-cadmium resistance protein CzcB n=1 Tax=Aquisphaera giovannonii TaxID=406548 RepID=A0A5B9W3J5_9BACT|nr:efflux RND transporter periplasmic adaptor subunit [Aquisphaera giovannonii]QEH34827.1 Cobalt-zinc-cadmium resistance protein CzcB [Aquisphaera giovannonii]